MEAIASSTEITILGWSVALLLVHIVGQVLLQIKDCGLGYAMSNRDDAKQFSAMTDHVSRALRNFLETYGAFIALSLGLAVTGKTGGMAAMGAIIWFWARVAYVPVFGIGIPVLRTAVWIVSVIGLVMMLIRFLS
jgi:uncharacterized MAPEG superfamily protein